MINTDRDVIASMIAAAIRDDQHRQRVAADEIRNNVSAQQRAYETAMHIHHSHADQR
jgi:hypothetical protein